MSNDFFLLASIQDFAIVVLLILKPLISLNSLVFSSKQTMLFDPWDTEWFVNQTHIILIIWMLLFQIILIIYVMSLQEWIKLSTETLLLKLSENILSFFPLHYQQKFCKKKTLVHFHWHTSHLIVRKKISYWISLW